jgi:hypothetical protein
VRWDADGKSTGRDWRANAVTAGELRTMTFPPVSYVVPGLIPEGLAILAGKPKIGKSWMALDIGCGVADGRKVFGSIQPAVGDVLYCALEDTNRRLQHRLHKVRPSATWPERLTLATSWRKLDGGGVSDIADWAASVSEPRLAIVDTLAGVRPERQLRDTTYDGDYRTLLQLQRLAGECSFAVLVLHHTRKMEADDPLDTISGTLGLVGCADTALVLARTPKGTTLYGRGRDVEEQEYAISFNRDTCRWTVLGEAGEVQRSDTRKAILDALANVIGTMTPEQIAVATGIKRNAVDQRLLAMVKDGEVIQLGRGQYVHPINVEAVKRAKGV